MSEPGTPAEVERQLGEEIDSVGRVWSRTIELGRRGFTISVLIFVLLIMQLLPWAEGRAGWETLAGHAGGVPQLFAATSTGIGVFVGAVALVSRRWWIAWCAALGGWFASVDGLLAIWSQQSAHASGAVGGGPGIGMIVAWIATIVLATMWMRTAFSRA
ncbi:membrane protein [Amycolatopsis benzoatilytica]|uniref:Rv2732c family membrane protein n=1 Tax=Amycolatopsis benzoatilytica TaxID=346045 RepID=UPI000361D7AE|nr:membrane protein [Amycolatopsis benzoatilytica]